MRDSILGNLPATALELRRTLDLSHEEIYTLLVALESAGIVHIHHSTLEGERIWMASV